MHGEARRARIRGAATLPRPTGRPVKKITAESPESKSADLLAGNRQRLRTLFPSAFTEDGLQFDVLRELMGGAMVEREERYGLHWHGKSKARRLALTPSTGTVRPALKDGVNWDTTQNLIIEGDNLEVLKLLQKSYAGKVKLIYIDPPYNTGGEFIYPDDYSDSIQNYLTQTGQVDGAGSATSTNRESSGRYHTAWLSMMFSRLLLARQLLSEDGAIVVSIDDHESHHLRELLDEVFGEENFVVSFAWLKRYAVAPDATNVGYQHDTLVMHRKTPRFSTHMLPMTDDQRGRYKNPDDDLRGPWKAADYTCRFTADERPTLYYPIRNPNTGVEVWPKKSRVWGSSVEATKQHLAEDRLWWGKKGTNAVPALKNFLSKVPDGRVPSSFLSYQEVGHTDEAAKELRALLPEVKFTAKPTRLIRHLLQIASDPDSIVLDFFAGSGTTGHAVMAQNAADGGNRRFILVQLPEPTGRADHPTIADITKERVRRAGQKLRDADPTGAAERDLGFRVFTLDSTNLKPWDPAPVDLQQQLTDHVDHIKPNRTEQDLLFEVLLKLGIDLSVAIETRTIGGFAVHNVGAGQLIACFGQPIALDQTAPLAQGIIRWQAEARPETARTATSTTSLLFRDSAFADDVAKQNLVATLEQAGLKNVRSI
jgi:adenine-specific DNA-methyltransferase